MKIKPQDICFPMLMLLSYLIILLSYYHLAELSKTLARTCVVFCKVRHLLTKNFLVSFYNSLFSSFLQYGIVVWSLTYTSYIKPIFTLQKKTVRAIAFENYYAPSSPIFLALELLQLQDLFELKLLSFVYKSVNGISPSCSHGFFNLVSDVHQHHTRPAAKSDIFPTRIFTL